MGNYDPFCVLTELNHLKISSFVRLKGSTVLFYEMTCRAETFHTIGEAHQGAFLVHRGYCSFMHRVNRKNCLEHIPGVFLDLFVTQAQAAVLAVDLQHHNVHLVAHLAEFARVLHFFAP